MEDNSQLNQLKAFADALANEFDRDALHRDARAVRAAITSFSLPPASQEQTMKQQADRIRTLENQIATEKSLTQHYSNIIEDQAHELKRREGFFVPLVKLLGLPDTASLGEILEAVATVDRANQLDLANERLTNLHRSRSSFLFTLAGILGLNTSSEPELLHAATMSILNQAVTLDPITQSAPLEVGDRVRLRDAVVVEVHGGGLVAVRIDSDDSASYATSGFPSFAIAGRVTP